ncbi:MAG: terminase large subunit domain-containing protein, partial [Sphingopyxis sp.]
MQFIQKAARGAARPTAAIVRDGGAHEPSLIEALAAMDAQQLRALKHDVADHVDAPMWSALAQDWRAHARPQQLPPGGEWRVWLMLAGRGFGKTRAGAEWIDQMARQNPGCTIALVGASQQDVRDVMIEGESGLMNLPGRRVRPIYNPALRRLSWPGGSVARCYSAAEPEGLRGPQHHYAWADEVARWSASTGDGGARGVAAWDNLLMGLRLGDAPRVLATSTPRALPIIRTILALPDVVVTGGSTMANAANLPGAFMDAMVRTYGGTALGRQEIGGELVEDIAGALWTRATLEACRVDGAAPPRDVVRVVVGVDPPASARGDGCGIVVCGLGADGVARVLADASLGKVGPERWARAVADTAAAWNADRVIAEANQGGDMVASVLRAADVRLPVKLVHASVGKSARAEPIAAFYEAGRVRHRGDFAALEDQLCGLLAGGGYAGP